MPIHPWQPSERRIGQRPSRLPYSNYLEWIGERDGMLVDRAFINDQFENSEEYKKFLFQYLKSRGLPEDVKRFLADLEN